MYQFIQSKFFLSSACLLLLCTLLAMQPTKANTALQACAANTELVGFGEDGKPLCRERPLSSYACKNHEYLYQIDDSYKRRYETDKERYNASYNISSLLEYLRRQFSPPVWQVEDEYYACHSVNSYRSGQYCVRTRVTSAFCRSGPPFRCSGAADNTNNVMVSPPGSGILICRPATEYTACQGTKYVAGTKGDGSPDCRTIPGVSKTMACSAGTVFTKQSDGTWKCAAQAISDTLAIGSGCGPGQALTKTTNSKTVCVSVSSPCPPGTVLSGIDSRGSPRCSRSPVLQCLTGSILSRRADGSWACSIPPSKDSIAVAAAVAASNIFQGNISKCAQNQVLAKTDNGIECVSLLTRISTAEADNCAGAGKILETKITQAMINGMMQQQQTWQCVEPHLAPAALNTVAGLPSTVSSILPDCKLGETLRKTMTGWRCSRLTMHAYTSATTVHYGGARAQPFYLGQIRGANEVSVSCPPRSHVGACTVYMASAQGNTRGEPVAYLEAADRKVSFAHKVFSLEIPEANPRVCKVVKPPTSAPSRCAQANRGASCTRYLTAHCVQ